MDRRQYWDTEAVDRRGLPLHVGSALTQCEHCDGERSTMVRIDYLRGHVCPDCDSSLDEMYGAI